MKWNHKSMGVKLWSYFILFAAVILAALWLLQTVFLQYFYNGMAIKNVKEVARQIAEQSAGQSAEQSAAHTAEQGAEQSAEQSAGQSAIRNAGQTIAESAPLTAANSSTQTAFPGEGPQMNRVLDELAYENSLLIFLTDPQGAVYYGTDEHSHVYEKGQSQHDENQEQGNPYRDSGEVMSWQIGAKRNLSLPREYGEFLKRLSESGTGTVGYQTDDGAVYVYGIELPSKDGDVILYISTSLGAVGATVSILRTQLAWVTAASLLLSFGIAFFIARRFSRPVSMISAQARRMADGNFKGCLETGFCAELVELADTLNQTGDKLAKTESFRREFLANISHDLRTPLTMIRGYAEMIRDISWEEETQREADLSVIIREADRLTSLVNDILEYTALQSAAKCAAPGPAGESAAPDPAGESVAAPAAAPGPTAAPAALVPAASPLINPPLASCQQEPQSKEFERVDISMEVKEALARFKPLCVQNGYVIDAQVTPHLIVRGNAKQLSRVLYNLIDNAASHGGERKKIGVTLTDLGPSVRVEVRDLGNGIPPEDLPYIWERYFTLKQQKRNEKGSGLGLAIAKEILLAHKAKFGVESQEGQGSVFWFEMEKLEMQKLEM